MRASRSFRETIVLDAARVGAKTQVRFLWRLASRPGFRTVVIYRVQAWLGARGYRAAEAMVSSFNQMLSGAEFVPGCRVGAGLLLPHPAGLVIGAGAVVGDQCCLLQGVTLGESNATGAGDHGYPVLEDEVLVGAGSVVLGRVRLARGARVAAMTLVTMDVPAKCVAFGNPAKTRPLRPD